MMGVVCGEVINNVVSAGSTSTSVKNQNYAFLNKQSQFGVVLTVCLRFATFAQY